MIGTTGKRNSITSTDLSCPLFRCSRTEAREVGICVAVEHCPAAGHSIRNDISKPLTLGIRQGGSGAYCSNYSTFVVQDSQFQMSVATSR